MDTRNKQRYLSMIGLYQAPIDGLDGPKTRNAENEFCELNNIMPAQFASTLMRYIEALPVKAYEGHGGFSLAIGVRELCRAMYHDQLEVWAYIMATVEHETNKSFYPVKESYYLPTAEMQERHRKSKDYYPWYARGYSGLTWRFNYEKYSDILGIDLTGPADADIDEQISYADRALDPKLALFILIHGMLTGSYTSRAISRYINPSRIDYVNARRVVNGTDCAEKIAVLASKWQKHYESIGDKPTTLGA